MSVQGRASRRVAGMAISPGRWLHVGIALWLAACSDKGDPHAAAGSASADDFCKEFMTAMAQHIEQCGCRAEDVAEWRAEISRCEEESPLDPRTLLAAGELTYHPAAKD